MYSTSPRFVHRTPPRAGAGLGRLAAVRLAIACGSIALALGAGAAVMRGKTADAERFVARYWSQNRPNLHYTYGCETGWHSFSFRPDGYFVYDGKTAGSWRIDHLNNVYVLTNTGERLELFYDGDSQLTQLERSALAPNSVFGTEFRTYHECPTDKVRLR
jgi:hypothetical protein